MDDIRTASVRPSTSRAAVRVAHVFGHATASMSAQPTFAAIPATGATKPTTKRGGYAPNRNWSPTRRPPGST